MQNLWRTQAISYERRKNIDQLYLIYACYLQFAPLNYSALNAIQTPYVSIRDSPTQLPHFQCHFPSIHVDQQH